MSWSYTGDPSARDLDMVRFLIGDTDQNDIQLEDETINGLLAVSSGTAFAAFRCANALAAKYARLVNKSIGDLSISYGQRADAYRKLAKQLQVEASASLDAYSSALYIADKQANEADPSIVQPPIRRGMHDYGTSVTEEEAE